MNQLSQREDFAGKHLKESVASLIREEGYNLVIEAANAMNEADTYHFFLKPAGWDVTYVTLNPSNSGNYKDIKTAMKNPNPVHLKIDGMDYAAIDEVIEASNSKNKKPIYIVNRAIGIMLTYRTHHLFGRSLAEVGCPTELFDRGVEKMAELWVGNLSKSKLKSLILTSDFSDSGVLECPVGSLIIDGKYGAHLEGINQATEDLLLEHFHNKGWTSEIHSSMHRNLTGENEARLYKINR